MITHRRLLAALAVLALGCGGNTRTTMSIPDPGPSPDPSSGDPSGPTVEAFRTTQPPASAPRPFNLPPVKTFEMGEGVKVYLVENHDLPTVSVRMNFEGGSALDPRGKEGMTSTCVAMLTEGTKKLDKLAYERALADIGSDIWTFTSTDQHGVSMRSLVSNLDATLALFVESMRSPAFRKVDLDRMVKRSVESIRQSKASAASVAGRLLEGITFGPDHPIGRVTTERSLTKVSPADCRRLQAQSLKPGGAQLFVVGDITEAQIRSAFAPILSKWKGKNKIAKMPARKPRAGRIFFVDIPGSEQSNIYLTHAGPGRADPAYFANSMMAALLGGGFTSRVNMNLREDKGYSYGARGGFWYSRDFGTFYAGAPVRSDSTVQSIRELLREIKDLQAGTRPPLKEELTRETNSAILGLPSRFDTASSALGEYSELVYHGLPLDYFNRYVEEIRAVKLADVERSAAQFLDPGAAQLLVVGDGKAVMKIRDDSGKDVDMVDTDGKPVTLRQALQMMAATGEIGAGELVILDADGNSVAR